MTGLTGLTNLNGVVFYVTNLTDRCLAVKTDNANLAGRKTNLCYAVFLSNKLSEYAGGTNKLCALTGCELDGVDECTNGNVCEGETVTGLDVSVCAGVKNVAVCYANGSCDVALLTCFVLKESDVSCSVGVVLDTDNSLSTTFKSLEVDKTVLLLVSAALVANGDSAVAVTAGVLLLLSEKALLGGKLGYFLEGGHRHMSSRRCSRLILNSRHLLFPPSD